MEKKVSGAACCLFRNEPFTQGAEERVVNAIPAAEQVSNTAGSVADEEPSCRAACCSVGAGQGHLWSMAGCEIPSL